jgi:hypothetical protein
MTTPSFAEYTQLSCNLNGLNPESLEERILTTLAAYASGQNPDGTSAPAYGGAYADSSLTGALDHEAITPQFTRYVGNPIFSASLSALGSIYWWNPMKVAGLIGSPINAYYAWYSTDHATSSAGGIGLATAPTPLGPWTDQGLVYVDTTSGYNDTECPSVMWDPIYKVFRLYYKQVYSSGSQSMFYATSPDGVNWTRGGAMLSETYLYDYPGDGSYLVGYFSPFRIGEQWAAWAIHGGGNYPHWILCWSPDGVNWTPDPHPLVNMAQISPDGGTVSRTGLEGSVPVWYRGRLWVAVISTSFTSGTSVKSANILVAPLSTNFRQIVGKGRAAVILANVITGITTANPGVVTTTVPHGFATGDTVTIAGVVGAPEANGTWTVTVLSDNTFSIPVNVTDTWTSGGTVTHSTGQSWETSLRSQRLFVDPGTNQLYLYYITASSTATPVTGGQLGVAVCSG